MVVFAELDHVWASAREWMVRVTVSSLRHVRLPDQPTMAVSYSINTGEDCRLGNKTFAYLGN